MKQLSLKVKMTCIVFLTIAVIFSIISFFTFRFFETEFQKSIAQHQFSMVAAIAGELDSKLVAAQDQVVAVAEAMSPECLTDVLTAENYLRGQVAALETFDNGLCLFSKSGMILGGTLVEPHMWGKDYSYREYFQETVRTRKPYISKPFTSVQAMATRSSW